MVTRRLLLAVPMLVALGDAARAGPPQPFEAAAFDAAQAAGRPILVQISAPWCPICKVQKPIIAALAQEVRFKDLAVFDIDFDRQKDLLRRFNARSQSTLIAYRGKEEVGRSIGETQAEWIEAFVEKAL